MIKKIRKPIVYLLAFILAFPVALFVNSSSYVQAADSSFRVADDFDSINIHPVSYDWSNNSASISNNIYVESVIESSSHPTDYLRSTGYGFGIPTWATINGIELTVERSRKVGSGGTVTDNSVKLVKNNVVVGINKADTSTAWTSSDVVVTYGGPNDLWGETWTPADINNKNFGSVFSAKRSVGGDRTVFIDQIRMKVYFSDTVKPVIAPHGDVVEEATSSAGAIVNYIAPKVTDNKDATKSATCSPISGSQFSLGTTTVNCGATDSSGNVAIPTTFNVTVQDTTGPVINTPTSTPDTTGEETTISVVVNDIVSGIKFVGISVNGSSYNPMTEVCSDYQFYYVLPYDSLNPVTYRIKAIDNLDNVTISDPLSVIQPTDNDKPVITLIGAPVIDINLNGTYHEFGATWSDNIDGNGSAVISGVVDTAVSGTYFVRYNYTDTSGNFADEVVRVINVIYSPVAPLWSDFSVSQGNGKELVIKFKGVASGVTAYRVIVNNVPISVPVQNAGDDLNLEYSLVTSVMEYGVNYPVKVEALGPWGNSPSAEKVIMLTDPSSRVVVTRAVANTTQEVLPQAPAEPQETATDQDQNTDGQDDSLGKIKGDEEIDTSEDEEDSVNWTPWIILFILIILAGAATGGYFYWFAGDDEMEEKAEKAKTTVNVKEKTKSGTNKQDPKAQSSKKSRRW